LAWTIELSAKAEKQLEKIDRTVARRIRSYLSERIATLENPKALGEPLEGALRPYWRFRVGDYRLICHIQDEIVTVAVVQIGHRSDIYRR
jgi:mRNA interferase RelE/StbE